MRTRWHKRARELDGPLTWWWLAAMVGRVIIGETDNDSFLSQLSLSLVSRLSLSHEKEESSGIEQRLARPGQQLGWAGRLVEQRRAGAVGASLFLSIDSINQSIRWERRQAVGGMQDSIIIVFIIISPVHTEARLQLHYLADISGLHAPCEAPAQ
ncbi:hypothetical protein BGW36DRAFT_184349 [Talaromyces proteolyticus]|uniref:Uncharacterized protein n=1 Tax=Talaromyces proteolyticus TaxID=1131652 RepID=A0AAD4KSZ9_9EURO|nr:uncharacterized protein BGW36DRAFT_184349 [Talaromyces proteolyticus]KAH8696315.1 hypothetical protein BGW36DRAFT_184349 [Talaromyces proteolyticus]